MSTRCRRFIPPACAINRFVHRERLAPFSSHFYKQNVYKALLMSGLMITLHESFTRFCCRDSFSQTTFMPKIEKFLVRDWCQVEQLLMFSIKFFIVDESLGYKVYLYREVSVSVSTPKASSVNELSARLFTFSFRQSKTSLRHESFSTLRRCLKMSGILFSMPNDNCCFYIFLFRKSPKRNADRNSRHAT